MKYSEKLKTCPVCGKEHGITKKEIYCFKDEHCKSCNSLLISPFLVFVVLPYITIIALCSRWTLFSGSTPFTDWYRGTRPYNNLLFVFLYFLQPLFPLIKYRNYWKEFWDKGL